MHLSRLPAHAVSGVGSYVHALSVFDRALPGLLLSWHENSYSDFKFLANLIFESNGLGSCFVFSPRAPCKRNGVFLAENITRKLQLWGIVARRFHLPKNDEIRN